VIHAAGAHHVEYVSVLNVDSVDAVAAIDLVIVIRVVVPGLGTSLMVSSPSSP
jgi:hypothetical protein